MAWRIRQSCRCLCLHSRLQPLQVEWASIFRPVPGPVALQLPRVQTLKRSKKAKLTMAISTRGSVVGTILCTARLSGGQRRKEERIYEPQYCASCTFRRTTPMSAQKFQLEPYCNVLIRLLYYSGVVLLSPLRSEIMRTVSTWVVGVLLSCSLGAAIARDDGFDFFALVR